MARLSQQVPSSGHTILVVDDDADLRSTVERLLRTNGHTVLSADGGLAALQMVREHDVHLVLLDYFMPEMTGEDVVRELRAGGHGMQVVLQTGYASERPPRDMLRDLDIQGYHDKSEGPDKLLVWVDAALKTYRHVQAITASRDGLNHILRAAPQLHRLQSLDELLRGILLQLQGILGFSSAAVATRVPGHSTAADSTPGHSSFVAVPDAQDFRIRVSTGRYEGRQWSELGEPERSTVIAAASTGRTAHLPCTALPLRVGDRNVGVVLVDLDPQRAARTDLTLLEVFAAQAAVAIENVQLFELATTDDLTGLMNRRAWMARLEESLQLGMRHGHPTSVVLLDIDHFKKVNDTHGHLAGDALLRLLGDTLRREVRSTDLAARYGGEELAVLLPHTSAEGAVVIAERIRRSIAEQGLSWTTGEVRVTTSIGVATHPGAPTDQASGSMELIDAADQALYRAKQSGRNQVVLASAEQAGAGGT